MEADAVVQPDVVVEPPPQQVELVPRERMWGLGLRASAIDRHDGGELGEGFGALLRFRPDAQLEVELEVGQDSWAGSDRSDTRGGAALMARLFDADFSPYLLAGGGAAAVREASSRRFDGYLAAGAGLSLHLGDQVLIGGDVRWIWSQRLGGDEPAIAPASLKTMPPASPATPPLEVRISTLVYF